MRSKAYFTGIEIRQWPDMLSLVTGVVNRPQSFQRLLDSIIANTSVEWELVVAEASEVPIVCEHERVKILRESPRRGHCKGYNAAFREAVGPWCLWLNDDTEVCPNYDVEALVFMEAHPRIGLGALHYSENGGPFHVNSAWNCLYANFGIFRKSVGEQVGFFDEDLYFYGADNSLAIRLLLADYGIADIPKARILHHPVNDQIRIHNQQYKIKDNQVLTQKYMPSHRQWVRTFRKHQIMTGSAAWSHGLQPQAVRG